MFALENEPPTVKGDAMNKFIEKFSTGIKGVLCGLDRLVLRGSLRQVRHVPGMMSYLWEKQVLLKNFGGHVRQISEQVKDASLKIAVEQKRPIQYLPSSRVSKEETARKIVAQDGIREGLVCVLSSVEPCMSFEVHRNAQTKKTGVSQHHPQVPAFVFLLDASPLGVHAGADPDLVSLFHPDLSQWTRMAGPTDGAGRNRLPQI